MQIPLPNVVEDEGQKTRSYKQHTVAKKEEPKSNRTVPSRRAALVAKSERPGKTQSAASKSSGRRSPAEKSSI